MSQTLYGAKRQEAIVYLPFCCRVTALLAITELVRLSSSEKHSRCGRGGESALSSRCPDQGIFQSRACVWRIRSLRSKAERKPHERDETGAEEKEMRLLRCFMEAEMQVSRLGNLAKRCRKVRSRTKSKRGGECHPLGKDPFFASISIFFFPSPHLFVQQEAFFLLLLRRKKTGEENVS